VAQFEIDGVTITVGGMAKGAGMVYPGMATMLAFITTDIAITASCLKGLLLDSVEKSFNCISIDGDRSTNDSVFVLASGVAGNGIIEREDSAEAILFKKALDDVTAKLAEKIVRDGEGASKFIEIIVAGASDRNEAKRLAFAVANSPLFKTAIYGEQPNWGRVLSALGASGVDLDPKGTRVLLQGQCVFQKGGASGADEDKLEELLKREVIRVEINLERGKGEAKILTCDLTPQYVDLNSS
jgi:glutamate N-acetyltransferase/amino-acid N-acetyltransferase